MAKKECPHDVVELKEVWYFKPSIMRRRVVKAWCSSCGKNLPGIKAQINRAPK
jgi:hypothetical protein